MLFEFQYLGQYQLLGFFMVAIIPEMIIDLVVFTLFPMLDMPFIPWAKILFKLHEA